MVCLCTVPRALCRKQSLYRERSVCWACGGRRSSKGRQSTQSNPKKGAERCCGHLPLPTPQPPPPHPPHIPGEQMGATAASNRYLKKPKRCEKGLGQCNSWITRGQAWEKNLETGMGVLREPFLWKRLKRCLPPNRAPATNQTMIPPSPVWESLSILGVLTKHGWGLFIGEWVMLNQSHLIKPHLSMKDHFPSAAFS